MAAGVISSTDARSRDGRSRGGSEGKRSNFNFVSGDVATGGFAVAGAANDVIPWSEPPPLFRAPAGSPFRGTFALKISGERTCGRNVQRQLRSVHLSVRVRLLRMSAFLPNPCWARARGECVILTPTASQPAPRQVWPKTRLMFEPEIEPFTVHFPAARPSVRPSGHNFLCSFCSLTPACFASIHARARSVVYSPPPPPLSFPSFGREQIVKEGKNKVGAGNGMDRLRRTSLAGHSIGRLRRSFRRVGLPCLWAK